MLKNFLVKHLILASQIDGLQYVQRIPGKTLNKNQNKMLVSLHGCIRVKKKGFADATTDERICTVNVIAGGEVAPRLAGIQYP